MPMNAGKQGILEWVQTFANGNVKELVVEHGSPVDLFELFKSAFINIDAAGGVVRKENSLLFIFRNEKWDLPKGKIDPGETNEEAGIREVMEECGITGLKIIKKLPSTYHIYQSPYKESLGQWIFKETFWFEMDYKGDWMGTPQHEEGISEVRWFLPHELDKVWKNTYENLKQIITLYRD